MSNYYNFFNSMNGKEQSSENLHGSEEHNCDCEDCQHEQNEENHDHCNCHNAHDKKTAYKNYKDFEFDDNNDMTCDIDPSKICDNCGQCLTEYNTDSDGYVQVKIDGIDKSGVPLDTLYQMYGLSDNDSDD